eukprot:896966-Prymnesium_polylepis.1
MKPGRDGSDFSRSLRLSRVPSGEHIRLKTREWGPLLGEAPAVLWSTRFKSRSTRLPRRLLRQRRTRRADRDTFCGARLAPEGG